MPDFELKARYDAKDGKWKVLVESGVNVFVIEDAVLGTALAQVALRVLEEPNVIPT